MVQSLFLGGGGDPEVSENFDREFFALLNPQSRILYIPFAWKYPEQLPDCYKWFCGLVHRYLTIPENKISMYDGEKSYDLNTFDAIYIGGGNTYKLRHELEQYQLINPLREFLASGKPLYGGSAGAIVFGEKIATVLEEKLSYPDYEGLKFCPFSMKCHYIPEEKEKLQKMAIQLQTTIYAIPEEGGLILDNNSHIIKQLGSVEKFDI